MILNATMTKYIKYAVIIIFSILLIGLIVNYFKTREDIAQIRKQAQQQVETAKKNYQQQLSIYNSQIQQYQQEIEQSQQQLDYYRRMYNSLQNKKESIVAPKTNTELRKRFEALGYTPLGN